MYCIKCAYSYVLSVPIDECTVLSVSIGKCTVLSVLIDKGTILNELFEFDLSILNQEDRV